jgi:hypothetical protein
MKKTCIILFSHANTTKKEQLLNESILTLKKLDLPIILISHAKIPLEIQDLVDYCLYEKNNFLIKETELFEESLPITEANYNTQYFFGGISTRCYVHKKTYGPAVINLYINGFNIAKYLGFEYSLLWEYDYKLNEITKEKISGFLDEVIQNDYDGFFIPCKIAGVPSITAIPSIFPVNKFIDYINHNIVTTPKEYIDVTNFEICEEWIYSFVKTLENPLKISFDDYFTTFSDLECNLISSGGDNPHFGGLNSGVFIDKNNKNNWIYSIFNDSNNTVTIDTELTYKDTLIFKLHNTYIPKSWYYSRIPENISNEILSSENYLDVCEKVYFNDTEETYQYQININNIDTISKSKVFFNL